MPRIKQIILQPNKTIALLSHNLMILLDAIMEKRADSKQVFQACKVANVVMRTENEQLQYVRVVERIDRYNQDLIIGSNGSVGKSQSEEQPKREPIEDEKEFAQV